MGADTRLGGRPRTRNNEIIRARHLPCPMCGYYPDQALPRTGKRHPLSSVVDEWIPRKPCRNKRCKWGCDTTIPPGTVDLTNCVEMHSGCNATKGNHTATAVMKARCRTDIEALMQQAHRTPQTLDIDRTW